MSALAIKPPTLPTLASQSLPRRVREVLGAVLKLTTDEIDSGLKSAMKDFDQQVFRLVESTVDHAARERWIGEHERFTRSRSDLMLHFFHALEAELANLQDPQVMRGHLQTRPRSGDELALVADLEIEETSALTDAATRTELQNSLPLYLLGQRFGVMAGRPAFDMEHLPIGPQALCRSIRAATEQLNIDVQLRLLFYRAFDRQIMPVYGNLAERLNVELARRGVLPTLQYVPVRARRVEQKPGMQSGTGDIGDHGLSLAMTDAERTARKDLRLRGADPVAQQAVQQAAELLLSISHAGDLASDRGFDLLKQLMAGRRQLLGKLNPDRGREGREPPSVVGVGDLQDALWSLQTRPLAPVMSHGRATPRTVGHLKQDMLAMLRRVSPQQEAPALSEDHNDAIDLVGMLYDGLMKDVKPGSVAAQLLSKLQVPLMRVALTDRAFFTRQEHPARKMLDTIADTGTRWLGDEDPDTALTAQVHSLVDRALHNFHGDSRVFQSLVHELMEHLQTVARKAEVAERRHVEAARGKEKLTLAREHAATAVEALIKDQKLPRFTRTMLSQAWTDVMALTSLRHGENSPAWRRQLQVAERLIEIAQRADGEHPDSIDPAMHLQREVEDALTKVGYQGDDVAAIARRLVHPHAPDTDESSSRTELTMRLKARARLGEDLKAPKGRRMPLTSAEQSQMQRIQQTPVGTWFEFTGVGVEPVRRRLSWLSSATGEVLFVNQRGQKNAEYSLEGLARLMAKGQVRVIEEEKGSPLDRAWDNVLNALRSFAVPASDAGSTP
jgi:hypothetical protein